MVFVFFLDVFIVSSNMKIIRRSEFFFFLYKFYHWRKICYRGFSPIAARMVSNLPRPFIIKKKLRRHEPPVRLPPSRLQDLATWKRSILLKWEKKKVNKIKTKTARTKRRKHLSSDIEERRFFKKRALQ